jgi:hypothetical protein
MLIKRNKTKASFYQLWQMTKYTFLLMSFFFFIWIILYNCIIKSLYSQYVSVPSVDLLLLITPLFGIFKLFENHEKKIIGFKY